MTTPDDHTPRPPQPDWTPADLARFGVTGDILHMARDIHNPTHVRVLTTDGVFRVPREALREN